MLARLAGRAWREGTHGEGPLWPGLSSSLRKDGWERPDVFLASHASLLPLARVIGAKRIILGWEEGFPANRSLGTPGLALCPTLSGEAEALSRGWEVLQFPPAVDGDGFAGPSPPSPSEWRALPPPWFLRVPPREGHLSPFPADEVAQGLKTGTLILPIREGMSGENQSHPHPLLPTCSLEGEARLVSWARNASGGLWIPQPGEEAAVPPSVVSLAAAGRSTVVLGFLKDPHPALTGAPLLICSTAQEASHLLMEQARSPSNGEERARAWAREHRWERRFSQVRGWLERGGEVASASEGG